MSTNLLESPSSTLLGATVEELLGSGTDDTRDDATSDSKAERTQALLIRLLLAGFHLGGSGNGKAGQEKVANATFILSRGIEVEKLEELREGGLC